MRKPQNWMPDPASVPTVNDMGHPITYIKETVIPEFGNPVCRYWKVQKEERKPITQQAFGQARKAGKIWTQEITVQGGDWFAQDVDETDSSVIFHLIYGVSRRDEPRNEIVRIERLSLDVEEKPVRAGQSKPVDPITPDPAQAPAPDPIREKAAEELHQQAETLKAIPDLQPGQVAVIKQSHRKLHREPLAAAAQPERLKVRKTCNGCGKFRVTICGLCADCGGWARG